MREHRRVAGVAADSFSARSLTTGSVSIPPLPRLSTRSWNNSFKGIGRTSKMGEAKMAARKLKVLYCIDSIGRGGTESQLVGLINRLDRQRFVPHLFTLRPSDDLIHDVACPRLELNTRRLFSPTGAVQMCRLVRYLVHNGIDVVHTFFQDSTLLGLTAARLAGVPVRLVGFRDLGFWRNPAQEYLMRRVYPLATGFLANSESVKDRVCTRDGLDRSRIRVVYNGVDSDRFPFVEHSESDVAIGILGNLNRRVKRTDLFLRAAGRVAVQHPKVRWHLIGDGEFRPEYEALAADLGIADRTVFAGRISDVSTYLQTLAIGVICSDSEGFNNAVLEYMLSGCAVVATAVGGNPEAVCDGRTGLLVPPGDEMALANALNRLVGDKMMRLRLAANARVLAVREFGWDRCVAAHEELYLSLLSAVRVS